MCQSSSTVKKPVKKIRLKEIFDTYFLPYTRNPDRKFYLTDRHFKSVHNIRSCRTSRLGSFDLFCICCGEVISLDCSCKDRFCPQCGVVETASWAGKLLEKLIDMYHHHVVVTLPSLFRPLSKRNKRVIYNLLFRVSSKVIQDWFKKVHGLDCGIVSVLHSSGSDLKYHPHVHMIVTGGGLDASNKLGLLGGKYLMNHKHLSKMIRWRFHKELYALYESGSLDLAVNATHSSYLKSLFSRVNKGKWIVSIQEGLSDASSIVKYVGRYTKRACISEYKLLSYSNEQVRFLYNDYKNSKRGEKPKVSEISLHYVEFFDRLLEHLPEKSFRMVRYYGIYSTARINKIPKSYLRKAEDNSNLLAEIESEISNLEGDFIEFRSMMLRLTGKDPLKCVYCDLPYKLFGLRYYNRHSGKIETIYYDDS